ncbi:hypothetical protein QUF74_03850 [Candidatus Halobeggiatoa sp. HSG11]|nr:hypothetical protein [Candidatus Halobeggiatoa sp. HSG11]
MEKLTFSKITRFDLKKIVNIQERGIDKYIWTEVEHIGLTDMEYNYLQTIKTHLFNYDTHLMNEATIWARAIYPLLLLVERGNIQAWAEVPLKAVYGDFELEGIADGAVGRCISGFLEAPFLIIVEAKRGLEAENPLIQLYSQILAAAYLNWQNDSTNDIQTIFGCYTIADTWKFLKVDVDKNDTNNIYMRVESSREYVEKLEIEYIFKLLKGIVISKTNK